MSAATAISVRGLGKTYRIAQTADRPTRATEAIVARVRHPLRRTTFDLFDALAEVSFDVAPGTALGIIGRNGAGKSTLLKILTRITAPTRGRAELAGRVGSLLEVGTGFHPELTGRENVFLNGTLLGMRRQEINRRFDEIVDFSGCGPFLDTPVKRYSSGMYVRLAFAVAAHLETEILVIDEVLSVGDADFQRRSVQKMRDAAAQGRTVLYVSHQLHTVTALCSEALLLDRGKVSAHGPVDDVLATYRASVAEHAVVQRETRAQVPPGVLHVVPAGTPQPVYQPAATKRLTFTVQAEEQPAGPYFLSCHINDANGGVIAQCDSRLAGVWFHPDRPHEVTLEVRQPWFKPGTYTVDVFLCRVGVIDAWDGAVTFDVEQELPYAVTGTAESYGRGMVLADFDFEVT